MNTVTIIGLSVAMSMDALAATVAKAASNRRVTFRSAMYTGLIFGAIQTMTTVAGWMAGRLSADYIASWAPLISLLILCGVGSFMLLGAVSRLDDQAQPERPLSLTQTIGAGLATSLDAFGVGASLAFSDIHVTTVAASFGLATFLLATADTLFGSILGKKIGQPAEVVLSH